MSPRVARPSLSRDAGALYAASLERIEDAEVLLDNGRWVLSMYVAGLAVEAILQAFALRSGEPGDARHDLRDWLKKCPPRLVDAVGAAPAEWSRLSIAWNNSLRYLPEYAVLGHLRSHRLGKGIKLGKEGAEAVLKVNAKRLVDAARLVHGKGLAVWQAA